MSEYYEMLDRHASWGVPQRLRTDLTISECMALKEYLGKGDCTFLVEYKGERLSFWNKRTAIIPPEYLEAPTPNDLDELYRLEEV